MTNRALYLAVMADGSHHFVIAPAGEHNTAVALVHYELEAEPVILRVIMGSIDNTAWNMQPSGVISVSRFQIVWDNQ